MSNPIVISGWQGCMFCVECDEELTDSQVYYSNGVCPYCGHDDDSTICAYKINARRLVRDGEWAWWQRLLGCGPTKWEYKK